MVPRITRYRMIAGNHGRAWRVQRCGAEELLAHDAVVLARPAAGFHRYEPNAAQSQIATAISGEDTGRCHFACGVTTIGHRRNDVRAACVAGVSRAIRSMMADEVHPWRNGACTGQCQHQSHGEMADRRHRSVPMASRFDSMRAPTRDSRRALPSGRSDTFAGRYSGPTLE